VADSIRRLAKLAQTGIAAAHPAALDGQGALRGLYVTHTHTGFESPGYGYALYVACGALRPLLRLNDSAYAHAARCMLLFVRDLVFPGEALPESAAAIAAIDAAIAKMRPVAPERPVPYTLPRVPIACRAKPHGHDVRSRRVIRTACAKHDELAAKSGALAAIRASFGTDAAAGSLGIDAMCALFSDLDAIVLTDASEGLARRATAAVERLEREESQRPALTPSRDHETYARENASRVVDKRRLAVLRAKIIQTGAGEPYEGVAAHVEMCAQHNLATGLKEHELGVLHAAFSAAGQLGFTWPMLKAAPPQGFVGALIATIAHDLTPTCLSDVHATFSTAKVAKVVQYKATERPGVGYVLYALLPLLDHASLMCTEKLDGYEHIRNATLAAIKRVLGAL
jgi:hypothetical protein